MMMTYKSTDDTNHSNPASDRELREEILTDAPPEKRERTRIIRLQIDEDGRKSMAYICNNEEDEPERPYTLTSVQARALRLHTMMSVLAIVHIVNERQSAFVKVGRLEKITTMVWRRNAWIEDVTFVGLRRKEVLV